AKEVGRSDEKAAERYLEAILKVISAEVYMNGICRLRNFGTFKIKKVGGCYKNTPIPTGGFHKIWVEPRNSMSFLASQNLKYTITGDSVRLSNVQKKKRKEIGKIHEEKKRLKKEKEKAEKAQRDLKERFK